MNPSEKRRKYGENYAVWLRNYQRARARALTRLRQRHPEEFQLLIEEERARDEAEGKTWLDINGRTNGARMGRDASHSGGQTPDGLSNQGSSRHLGAEA